MTGENTFKIFRYAEVTSTMTVARELILDDKSPDYFVVVAEKQVAGRGQNSKHWVAPDVGLFATFVTPIPNSVQKLVGFSVSLGCAIAVKLEEHFAIRVGLKWPNDLVLVVNNLWRKVAGILVEVSDSKILIGVGVNIEGLPQSLSDATTLSDAVKSKDSISAQAVLRLVTEAVELTIGSFSTNNSELPFLAEANSRLVLKDKNIELTNNLDSKLTTGICRGIARRGALIIESEDVSVEIVSGSISNWDREVVAL